MPNVPWFLFVGTLEARVECSNDPGSLGGRTFGLEGALVQLFVEAGLGADYTVRGSVSEFWSDESWFGCVLPVGLC